MPTFIARICPIDSRLYGIYDSDGTELRVFGRYDKNTTNHLVAICNSVKAACPGAPAVEVLRFVEKHASPAPKEVNNHEDR